jgi:acyl-CoA synthetase (NDP forming)
MSEADAPARPKSSEHRLAPLFEPKSIALVGATEKSYWSVLLTNNFNALDYKGKVFAVNRNGNDVFGLKGYRNVAEIGEPVDVAYMMVPQAANLDVISELAAADIRFAVVLSSGYAEMGEEGQRMQDEMAEHARSLGVTLWGPNSLGYVNVGQRIPVSTKPITLPLLPPSVAIITQSGASAVELNDYAHSQNIGCSFLAATGNEAMVRIADLVDYLVDHDDTRAIAIFCESIRDEVGFIKAAEKARAANKPIVILKIGRSELSSAVARAHTGSIVGDDKVFDAVCERLGVVRVYSTEELISTAGLLAAIGPLKAPGLAFVSTSGGACTLVADAAESAGVTLPPFPEETVEALRAVLPGYAATYNPLDFTGAWMGDPELIAKVIPPAAAPPEIGLVAVNVLIPQKEGQGFPPGLPPLGRACAAIDKPSIVATTTSRMLTQYSRDEIARHKLPHVMCGIDTMLRAVGKLAKWSERLKKTRPLPAIAQGTQAAGPKIVGERAVLDHLARAGVPVIPATVARTRAEAEAAAADSKDPLVLKIASPDIEHKTEVGGVRLNVAPGEVGDAFDGVLAAVKAARPDATIDGVIVSPMRKGGVELLVGITRDPVWGPMLSVGLGGVLVEIMADVATAPLPVERDEVKEMLGRLRGKKLLEGYRGAKTAGLDAIADAVAAIGKAALAMGGNLESLEVNPLLVGEDRVEALDALAIWAE